MRAHFKSLVASLAVVLSALCLSALVGVALEQLIPSAYAQSITISNPPPSGGTPVKLQTTTPGTQQVGNSNINGTSIQSTVSMINNAWSLATAQAQGGPISSSVWSGGGGAVTWLFQNNSSTVGGSFGAFQFECDGASFYGPCLLGKSAAGGPSNYSAFYGDGTTHSTVGMVAPYFSMNSSLSDTSLPTCGDSAHPSGSLWQTGAAPALLCTSQGYWSQLVMTNPKAFGGGVYVQKGSIAIDSIIQEQAGTIAGPTAAIASGACAADVTVVFSGATTASAFAWSFNAAPPATYNSLTVTVWANTNAANLRVCNPSAGSVTPAAATFNIRALN